MLGIVMFALEINFIAFYFQLKKLKKKNWRDNVLGKKN